MLGVIVAAAMAASFFFPWFDFFGNELGPAMLLQDGGPQLGDLPWQGFAFLASFAIAALAAVLALMGRAAGILMLIAGAIPFGILIEGALNAKGQLDELGLPIPRGDNPVETFNRLIESIEFMAIGLPVYFIAAALLVLIGLGRMVKGA